MTDQEKTLFALKQIDPARLDYSEWCAIGMALKAAGCSVGDFDAWSRKDKRYHPGEPERKWKSFNGSGVNAGTIFKFCIDHGGRLPETERPKRVGRILEEDDYIGGEETSAIVSDWTESHGMPPPPDVSKWDAAADFRRYIETLFQPDEKVGYVVTSWESESGVRVPAKGNYSRTAAQLLEELAACGGDLGNVLGDWEKETGAWIRFNPLDGKDVRDANVTAFRYALIESDSLPIDQQYDLYREMELPVAAMVHSGGKSVHAIVRIDAADMAEYKKRVDYLYAACRKAGLEFDKQNRNPSRLSRLPGATRNGKPQYLIETNVGKASFQEWKDWIEELNDELPDPEGIASVWDNPPPLSEEVIKGVLRKGHKMLMAGPSKAAKSFGLIELTIAIAEGRSWMGFSCARGRVLYVNLELDRASCLHRFKDVYSVLGWSPDHLVDIDIWNLRGKAMPMDKLAPKLIRRAAKRGYLAIIIDPIYKVITGDENSASEMANFCNQFDRICDQLGTATIYCHHHSKGSQGQKVASDRASGSGVFARDPDACLDLIELKLDGRKREVIADRLACEAVAAYMDKTMPSWRGAVPQDDAIVWPKLQGWLTSEFAEIASRALTIGSDAHRKAFDMSAWRIEGTLREFKGFAPRRVFFDYPIHKVDQWDLLADARAEGELPSRANREEAIAKKKDEMKNETLVAFESLYEGEPVTLAQMAEHMGIDEKSVKRRVDKVTTLKRQNGLIWKLADMDTDTTSKCPVDKEGEE
jgi:RecA-family ATPase